MGHGYRLTGGRSDHVDLGVVIFQRLLQHLQGKSRSACGDAAGSGQYCARSHHAGSCITFRGTQGDASFQGAAFV